MEINIERSPQHWSPSEGSNSELFAHENGTLTARPQLHLILVRYISQFLATHTQSFIFYLFYIIYDFNLVRKIYLKYI